MKIDVQKNHLKGQILYRSLVRELHIILKLNSLEIVEFLSFFFQFLNQKLEDDLEISMEPFKNLIKNCLIDIINSDNLVFFKPTNFKVDLKK